MKKLFCVFLSSLIFLNCISYSKTMSSASTNSISFNINSTDKTGKTINKLTGYMNVWGYEGLRNAVTDNESDISFVDYIELMTATGGSEDRDLIDENGNMIQNKLDALAQACQGVLNLGARPLIKLGSIPFYFTMNQNPNKIKGDVFGFNVFPPDEDMYDEYQQYLENVLEHLINRFGIDEVKKWRFGVMTEYENADWFYVLDSSGRIDAQKTMIEYFKIYDYSVQALENKLGAENVYVGAHSMTVTEGLWDERSFIDHVATGYNYAKGSNSGAQIDYLAASFYDNKPGQYTSGKTLNQCFELLREYAVSKGLTSLEYGVDEGRILSGVNPGSGSGDLNTRCVGHLWQAAYDARMYKTMLDNDIDYFSMWSWTSDSTIGKGYPTVSYHVADIMNKMVGADRLNVTKSNISLQASLEAEAVAGFDSNKKSLGIVAYNFKNNVSYKDAIDYTFNISVPEFAGQSVLVGQYCVDDDSNFFDEWWVDRSIYGITNDKFSWSADDPTIDSPTTLADEAARQLYYSTLRNKYVKASTLTPEYTLISFDDSGNATINCNSIRGNSIVYYELMQADELNIAASQAKTLVKFDYENYSIIADLLELYNNYSNETPEERDKLAEQITQAMNMLIKKSVTADKTASNSFELKYDYAKLYSKLEIKNASQATNVNYYCENDVGSPFYSLEENDTYDQNGFHVWSRTFENGESTSHLYVDRYSVENLSELGGIVNAEFSTWGKNHHHTIGIADINTQRIFGENTSVSVLGTQGNEYLYELVNFSAGSPYSAGTKTDYAYTPSGATVSSQNIASINGPVPLAGESVTFRIGTKTSVIDGYGWNNLFHIYSRTDVTVTGYDSTSLRAQLSETVGERELYTNESYARYILARKAAINTLNNSYLQEELNLAEAELIAAKNELEKLSDILYGDADLDGFINGMDEIIIRCVLTDMLTQSSMSQKAYLACDADRNGAITEEDISYVIKQALFIYD